MTFQLPAGKLIPFSLFNVYISCVQTDKIIQLIYSLKTGTLLFLFFKVHEQVPCYYCHFNSVLWGKSIIPQTTYIVFKNSTTCFQLLSNN